MRKLPWQVALFIVSWLAISDARGPHHPRGEVVRRHTHYKPGKKAEKMTQDDQLLHDKDHLQEHLDEVAPKVDLSKMTEDELEVYYFLLHDSDKNSKLDGLELLNAILHTTHDETSAAGQHNNIATSTNSEDFDNFVDLVDQVLRDEDKNHDGYLDYSEYVDSRKRSHDHGDPPPMVDQV
ncbi:multiple coagulation factor deficiency protein 2 homolog [Rhynchophorus ferrugineus]